MTDLLLQGAQVLWPDGLAVGDLAVSGEMFADSRDGRAVDLSGFRVLPGIVDIHGDGFERHLAPRRGVMKDFSEGLRSVDAELAANGITTAVLAQFWSWEGGMRGPEHAARLVDGLRDTPDLRVDMQVQLRFETHMLNDYEAVEALIDRGGIGYVVLNDHLPHDALIKGKKPPRLTGQALKGGRSPEAHLAMMQAMHDRTGEVPAALEGLVARLRAKGVIVGSHDDNTTEGRAWFRSIGVTVSEFPETEETARFAQDGGDHVILGAPNVVRGGSHAGKVSAAELIGQGIGVALASDYHYPAPRQAALALAERIGLEAAWGLVSSGPAAVLGLTDRGRIKAGLRADFVVLDDLNRVVATFVRGRPAFMAGEVVARFIG
jgi:alpha-D-ribose 1-methylphosphonate 5-triphosphate diphosphatase